MSDTVVKGRDGAWTTIGQSMAADGLELDKAWGAFRAPGAPDRQLQWYDWRQSGRKYEPALAVKETPTRWFWTPLDAAETKQPAKAIGRRR